MPQVYCRYCEQTYQTDDMEKCSLCRKTGGLVDPLSPDAVPMKVEQPSNAPQAGDVVRSVLLARRLVLCAVGGFFLIALGIWLVLQPELRSNPQRFSINDLGIGIGPILAGLFLLIVAFFTVRRLRAEKDSVPTVDQKSKTS